MNTSIKLDGMVVKHSFDLSRDNKAKKAGIKIRIHGDFDYTGLTVDDLLAKCVRHDAIIWQHRARPVYDQFKDGQKVKVLVTDLAQRATVDPAAVQRNKYMAADTVDQKAQLLHDSTGIPLKDCRDIVKARMATDV